jgi:DNA-binding beta-propeller fold protein YncE
LTISSAALATPAGTTISIPGGEHGIGFDDLRSDPATGAIYVPAGVTGSVYRIDPSTGTLSVVKGFASTPTWSGHNDGPTSLDVGLGGLFVVDRTSRTLDVARLASQTIVASVPLGGPPDLARYSPSTREVWVTEPAAHRIEVLDLVPFIRSGAAPTPKLSIDTPGGPQALVLDSIRHVAYTHLPDSARTVAIDLETHSIRSSWPCGCDDKNPQGIALDAARGQIFTACDDGTVLAFDANRPGVLLGKARSGRGVNIIAYNDQLHHLYVPGAESATMAILTVKPSGSLELLAVVPVPHGAHSVATDHGHSAYVCDPEHGALVVVEDPFPADADRSSGTHADAGASSRLQHGIRQDSANQSQAEQR